MGGGGDYTNDHRTGYSSDASQTMKYSISWIKLHFSTYGAHQFRSKLQMQPKRPKYYLIAIIVDCMEFAKRCQVCQYYGTLQNNLPNFYMLAPFVAIRSPRSRHQRSLLKSCVPRIQKTYYPPRLRFHWAEATRFASSQRWPSWTSSKATIHRFST